MTSTGNDGAGGFLSQPVASAQSRTGCLSNDGGVDPGWYVFTSQKREESGVRTSSHSASSPSIQPSSNLVSAMMMPFSAASSAPRRYKAMLSSDACLTTSAPTMSAAWSTVMFSSWPVSAFVDG